MPILNYSTQIKTEKTVGEITQALTAHGVASYHVLVEDKQPVAIVFTIVVDGIPCNYRLPSKWEGIYRIMQHDPKVPRKLTTPDQAKRVSWRITKDWVLAQLAFIEAQQAELPEVFLPYSVDSGNRTIYERIQERGMVFLADGE